MNDFDAGRSKQAAPANGAGAGIFMPGPDVMSLDQLKNGDTIALNRPQYIFLPMGVDIGEDIKVSKTGPIAAREIKGDEITQLKLVPPGYNASSGDPLPRGRWIELSDKQGDKPGQRGTVKVSYFSEVPFGTRVQNVHVRVGSNIFFMAGGVG
jgi:hypothetical protein